MAILTSVPKSERKFPAEKDGLKRFYVEGVLYASTATEAKEIIKATSSLDAALITK